MASDRLFFSIKIIIALIICDFFLRSLFAYLHRQKMQVYLRKGFASLVAKMAARGTVPDTTLIITLVDQDPATSKKALRAAQLTANQLQGLTINVITGNSVDTEFIKNIHDKHPSANFNIITQAQKDIRSVQAAIWAKTSDNFVINAGSGLLINPDAVIKLIAVMIKNPNLAAVSGRVESEYANHSFFQRLIVAYRSFLDNISVSAESYFGGLPGWAGQFGIYRSEILKEVTVDYVNQSFLGQVCNDKISFNLKNLLLSRGFDIVYLNSAKAKSYINFNLGTGFVKILSSAIRYIRQILLAFKFWHKMPIYSLWGLLFAPVIVTSLIINLAILALFAQSRDQIKIMPELSSLSDYITGQFVLAIYLFLVVGMGLITLDLIAKWTKVSRAINLQKSISALTFLVIALVVIVLQTSIFAFEMYLPSELVSSFSPIINSRR